ncbi:50S ribosomal protein L29 [Candidatus Uhrbacteria bacterium]|nr:50S ribosomal protein L29 [Candidatus Uhrbacteria bacterium]
MKFKELRDRTMQELDTLLSLTRKEVVALRMNVAAGQLKDVREIREKKTLIARILTLLATQKK